MSSDYIQGRIPEQLVIYTRKFEEVTHRTEDGEIVIERVRKAFAVEKGSKSEQTADKWANSIPRLVWTARSKLALLLDDMDEAALEAPNDPISGLRIITYEIRGEGGRAWKVVTPDGLYYDLREDTLLDALKTVGVQPDGTLNGEYIWAVVGSQYKLVRVGSAVHKKLLLKAERAELPSIKVADLKPGYLYKAKNGVEYLFCGLACSVVKPKEKLQVWMECYNGRASAVEYLEKYPTFAKVSSVSVIEELPGAPLEVSHIIPTLREDGITDMVRGMEYIRRYVAEANAYQREWMQQRAEQDRATHLSKPAIRKATLVPYGETPTVDPRIAEWVTP